MIRLWEESILVIVLPSDPFFGKSVIRMIVFMKIISFFSTQLARFVAVLVHKHYEELLAFDLF